MEVEENAIVILLNPPSFLLPQSTGEWMRGEDKKRRERGRQKWGDLEGRRRRGEGEGRRGEWEGNAACGRAEVAGPGAWSIPEALMTL